MTFETTMSEDDVKRILSNYVCNRVAFDHMIWTITTVEVEETILGDRVYRVRVVGEK